MYKGNNTILKSLLMIIADNVNEEGSSDWKPTQAFLELILSRIELASDIAGDEPLINIKNHSLLKLSTKGFVPKKKPRRLRKYNQCPITCLEFS